MNVKKQIISIFILSLFISFCYYFLISKFIVYPTVIPMISNGNTYLFADWQVIIGSNLCKELGYDVYLDNPCDPWGRKHVYGEILLYFPFVKKFQNFYFDIFPVVVIYIFIVLVLTTFHFKNYITYLTSIVLLLSFPVILAIERAQLDLLIFILMVFLAYFKNKILSFIILVFVTISKFYPIILSIIFFFEKKLKKILIKFIIFIILISLIFFIQSEQIIKIYENKGQFSAFGIYDFSLVGTLKYLKNYYFLTNNKIYSILMFLFLFVPSLIFFVKTIKYFSKKKTFYNLNYNFFEDRLYIFSSAIILICYFSLQNYVYREIFFIGLVPWVLKIKILDKDQNFFSFFYYFLMFKFLISIPITYVYMNKIFEEINPILLFFKYSVDLYLISLILAVFLIFFIKLLNLLKKNI